MKKQPPEGGGALHGGALFVAFCFAALVMTISSPAKVQAAAAAAQNFSAPYDPRDVIFLDCGSSGTAADTDGTTWYGDAGSKYAPSLAAGAAGVQAASQDPSVPQIPYLTARVFTSPFTYTFPLASGRKFLRLYFYPANYSSHSAADALFSVAAGGVTLLSNFSAYQTSQALNFAYLIREFSVEVPDGNGGGGGGGINVTLTPSTAHPGAFAFVNGIEIVSSPDFFNSSSPMLVNGGSPIPYTFDPSWSLQTMYRLNVGGQSLSPAQDSGLFRSWDDDSPFIYGAAFGVTYAKDPNVTIGYTAALPASVAPEDVYSTARSMGPNPQVNLNYNLTWIFSVDGGFYYLVRLHFCEIQYPYTKTNQRVFDVFINNQTALPRADVFVMANGGMIGDPVYADFVVVAGDGGGMVDLWLELHPDVSTKPEYYDAILNGIEVFKLQDSNNNLAGPNPAPLPAPDVDLSKVIVGGGSSGGSSGKSGGKAASIAGGVAGGVVAAAICAALFSIRRRRCRRRRTASSGKNNFAPSPSEPKSGWLPLTSVFGNSHTSSSSAKTGTTGAGSYATSLPSTLCRHFSFAEIKSSTRGFDESLILGVGGFGKVYRGELDGGESQVAIKRGNPLSEQGVHEFQTEIEMLSKLRHRHLVSLIGYCEEDCEMILVYDYMSKGTLREHLYKTDKPPLPWKTRLEICIGAARGLHYLHTGAKHTIIHRDVKTTNILLDENLVAKVSDFGLSKTGPAMDHTHVSTVVKGSFGYLDPEYFRRQQLTEKSDVYSFGVVLFEVLCARPPLLPALPKEQVSLAEWAGHCQRKGVLEEIVDPHLRGKIAPQCFRKFAETAERCVSDQSVDRPSMGDVLWSLEFALQLQEAADGGGAAGKKEKGSSGDEAAPLMMMMGKDGGGVDGRDSGSLETSITTTTTTTATTVSIGGRSLASDDSDNLTPSAVFSQIMNPKGR